MSYMWEPSLSYLEFKSSTQNQEFMSSIQNLEFMSSAKNQRAYVLWILKLPLNWETKNTHDPHHHIDKL
jgi:hypothetical protein